MHCYLWVNSIRNLRKKDLKNLPAGYIGKFYRNLADNVDHDFLKSEFYGKIANDYGIPSDDVQKYLRNEQFCKRNANGH